ncbi:MAG: cyclic pyranopterin monophosphate synthase MoaC [Actinobacteria bacterium]|nr:cyclic pyranopterin monophosphate synthase MoaC [Actinomycetota bacterium]MCB9414413.1 cyclic pyranopterin monophosphate synthase MoaC [Actinomycetota bacterium]MCB9424698.1 cyclic pyranopterin monophosphate synthase MoaC [Actinomycetota bacterium]HRY09401.1 cyclic pyranopterin monophosphate synthase MoaC [Candidatus Nanopelagicales bacterium]
MSDGLTHIDERGQARMVDVAEKDVTVRTAVAVGEVHTHATAAIREGAVAKGDVLATARIAGIMAAKRTSDLVPMCHPIAIHGVVVEVAADEAEDIVRVRAQVRTADRTGVEMEALTAVTVACLTIVDMTKAVDPAATITGVAVVEKTGGRSGDWSR